MLTPEEIGYGNSYIMFAVSKRKFDDLVAFAYADDDAKRVILKEYLTETVAFAYADDDAKRVILKEYLTETVKPVTDNDLASYTEKVAKLTEEKTAIDTYIK